MNAPLHCQMIQAGEIQAIVGDAFRNGVGGTQYCGLWSLTSQHYQFNAYGNSYAGLIPGELRGRGPGLCVLDERTCKLTHHPDADWPVWAEATYQVKSPHYVDHVLEVSDEADVRRPDCDFREVSWCCYMNCPGDSRIRFLSKGQWMEYISPEHGKGSRIAPSYLPNTELEQLPPPASGQHRPFHWDWAQPRFDAPFYYGRLGPMLHLLIFDHPRDLRFYCSPTGGGGSLLADKTCPAWDFLWVVSAQRYQVGRTYRFRTRLVYKLYVDDDDVLHEVRRAQKELEFEGI